MLVYPCSCDTVSHPDKVWARSSWSVIVFIVVVLIYTTTLVVSQLHGLGTATLIGLFNDYIYAQIQMVNEWRYLMPYIHWTHFEATIWWAAFQSDPPDLNPIQHGGFIRWDTRFLIFHLINRICYWCVSEQPCSTDVWLVVIWPIYQAPMCHSCHQGDHHCCNKNNTTE